MSKIQKALRMLRKSSDVAATQPKSPRPPVSGNRIVGTSQTNRNPRPEIRVRARHIKDGDFVEEDLPDFKIDVSLESLLEQGLQAHGADVASVADQFRRIKRPILNAAFGMGMPESENANVIMMTSALPKAGKSFCSFNLATSIAIERDVGAILVDADVLKPNISSAFGLKDRVGLIDYLLSSTVTIDEILVTTDLHGIVVIPSGQKHPEATELLASHRMKQFVEKLSHRFQTRAIIVDTPPFLITNESHVLADHMGQIVLVIEAGVSPQDSVVQVLSSLNRNKPINAILNKARDQSFGGYGSSGYGG